MAVVIVHPFKGVYLGVGHRRFLYWSNLDSNNQVAAIAFEDEAEANEHMGRWDGGRPLTVRLVRVVADLNADGLFFASERCCRLAGAGGWVNERTPAEGRVQ